MLKTKKKNKKQNKKYHTNKIKKNIIKKYKFEYNNLSYNNLNYYVNKLSKFIKKNGIDSYPFKKYGDNKYSANYINITKRFNNLKKYKYKLIYIPYKLRAKYNLPSSYFKYYDLKTNLIKPTILLFDNSNYLKYDLISDYFQEQERIKCKRKNTLVSPYNYWFNNKKNNLSEIIKICIKKFNGVINSYTLNESLYLLTNECSQFRPTVLVSIIKMFGGRKRILDLSAGWGDRLIGAIAAKVDYYFGADPNTNLHKGYKNIIKFFNVNPKRFIIKDSGFENVKIQMPPNNYKFDLIMTSPPYFDLEIYSDNKRQSILYRRKNEWLNKFMFPSLKKAWKVLEINGILALNINNKTDTNKGDGYVEDIINYVNNFEDSNFRGCISYADYKKNTNILRNPQPIWIWIKI